MMEVAPLDERDRDFAGEPVAAGLSRTFETLAGSVRSMLYPGGMRTVGAASRFDYLYSPTHTVIIDAARISMPEFAKVLRTNLDRPVVDRTGLTGLYQFRIELDANQTMLRLFRGAGITTDGRGARLDLPTGVSTFRAVESLGLKLERRRTPFEVIVVEHLERQPTEN